MLAMGLFFHPLSNQTTSSITWRDKIGQMDLPGTAILISSIVCLLLALQWGGSVYEWCSVPIIVLLVVAGGGAAAFVAVQIWKQERATVPPRIFKQRSVACSTCYVFCAGGALNVFQYFVG